MAGWNINVGHDEIGHVHCDLTGHSIDYVCSHVYTRDPSRIIPKQLNIQEKRQEFTTGT